jgi:hypothetical protein
MDHKKIITCIACGDTGRNSKGNECLPCLRKERQPLKDRILAVVEDVFDEWHAPETEEIIEAVQWACKPRVAYVVAFKKGDDIGVVAGPNSSIDSMLCIKPEADPRNRTAYIIEMVQTNSRRDGFLHRPVARWHNSKWQLKKERK